MRRRDSGSRAGGRRILRRDSRRSSRDVFASARLIGTTLPIPVCMTCNHARRRESPMKPALLIPLSIFLFAARAATAAENVADEAGVRDAENRWGEAFVSGDTATLDALLDAEYVSTGATGKPRPKAEIIGLASAYAKAHPGEHAKPLPATSTIRVIGNAAVVQHHNAGDTSVDVFYFRDGRWYAWYSQHTRIGD